MIDAMDDFFGDMDRNRKRMEYNRDVEKLELYLETVQQIINQFEETLYALQSAHQQYTSEWSGRSKDSYENVNNEILQAAYRLYDVRDELYRSLHHEMSRLREEAEAI
ncbi:WXG100 family type VII secretion target [Priestia flexa]|uniref:WXG100 family type VII secretion target n=1 Tax=Priestia flexa TaxID=86664 RepID=A0ABU4J167_9BACI|nr:MULTISPECIES: WXG100 family type VII secretion target [Bacillaceae]MCA1202922.1 WXG100 family type VII secretion target [Priestia flexa]MCM3067603.1 WXG100 family type VII secretion target [Priestia flexa]MDW8514792.1 WXG100 family type VII secretion target [Priestia flexa]MEC0664847.1 WXG100 family type VII secretion target [Priestia flexa]MED3824832.1 WXG100 family type VII secretion target [Priestia flexa]